MQRRSLTTVLGAALFAFGAIGATAAPALAADPIIPTTVTYANVTITNVSIAGGGNVATLPGGTTASVAFTYNLGLGPGYAGFTTGEQLYAGLSTGAQHCFYSGTVGTLIEGGPRATTIAVALPTLPGTYYLAVDIDLGYRCEQKSWTDLNPATSAQYFGAIIVTDGTDPVVTVPAAQTVTATSAAGAVVNFTATATDAVDGTLTPTCEPESGSTFPVGTTVVTCTATDLAKNDGTASFSVTVVKTADQLLTDLLASVRTVVSTSPTRTNLVSIVKNAQAALVKGDISGACTKLTSFIGQVQAQSGKKIMPVSTATSLISAAAEIKTALGSR